MRRVIIESPLSGDLERNLRYGRLCLLDCLQRGEAPFASHLLYTQVWDDLDGELRKKGMAAGVAWYPAAEACVVYLDLGKSSGMQRGIDASRRAPGRIIVEYRHLPAKLLAMLDGEGPQGTEGATTW
jgi:hypothetical protein